MRGYFGIGIENSKREVNVGTLWRSAQCFGAAFIFTIGRRFEHQPSDTTRAERHIPIFEYRDSTEFFQNTPLGARLVGIEIGLKTVPLPAFIHPEQAIYILGPEDGSLSKEIQDRCNFIVSIDSKYCLNVATAGSIVMYDRSIK